MFEDEFFYPDIVSIIKTNGEKFDGVRVQIYENGKKMTTQNADIDLDPGDTIERPRPSGSKEKYLVKNASLNHGIGGIFLDHYVAVIKRVGAITEPHSKTIHLHGIGNRYNENSIDNSVNHIDVVTNDFPVFNDMLKIARNIENSEEQAAIVQAIKEMQEAAKNNSNLPAKYTSFIQTAANHMTLFSPFMPLLTKILLGN